MSCFVDLRQVPSRLLLDRPAVVHWRTGGPSRTRHPRAARRSAPRAAWSTPLGRLRPRPRVGTAHYESEEVLSMRVIKARRGLGVCAGAWLAISAFLLMAGAAGRGNPNRRVGRSRDPRRRSPRPRPRVSRQTDSSRRLPRTAPARPLQGASAGRERTSIDAPRPAPSSYRSPRQRGKLSTAVSRHPRSPRQGAQEESATRPTQPILRFPESFGG
jgi:hypothetical protein